ncbi:hypothetical protein [Flavihumibacter sp. UBA7668]|uniref:hypothetical protein n=1 Tax=Flavihumibacter sp. UBA7668 TaxID=1946542 RepID=UPI0025B9914C|nr:hypothetical protein [Flavihumibacter sp. UBA7668]
MSRNSKVFLILISLSLIVYLPVINKGLASDDFGIMHRIVFGDIFFLDGFFRPLSDISLYFCYLVGGFNGWIYNLFNIVLHAASAFLLFRTTLLLFNQNNESQLLSISAAILFVLYPFHNEAIVWVVGRASNLSSFLGFCALYIAMSGKLSMVRCVVIGLLYFGSLSTYETSITMPAIASLFLWLRYPDNKRWVTGFFVFGGTAVINLIVRSLLVKEIVGDYGSRMFDPSLFNNLIKFLKTAGRLFLPPMASSSLMILLAILVFAFVAWIFIQVWKKAVVIKRQLVVLSLAVIFSCAVPFLFGVSTRTFEGDRLLYFPSFFLCIWISFVLINLLSKKRFYYVTASLGLFFLIFLQINNFTWRKADQITKTILADMSELRPLYSQMVIHRLPEEYKGAHVFRNGFLEALLIQGVDTAGIRIGSFQKLIEDSDIDLIFHPKPDDYGNILFGDSLIERTGNKSALPLIYWNNRNMVIFE